MVSAIIADGHLLKKKRDDRRNFLGSKYQRRYFELTADNLAYAKDPKELKDGGGDIEFFAIHELKYIKKLEDCKLEMKFPERVLRVKAESPKEHDRWYEAIKDARQKKLDGNNTPQAKQLETLKEHTKQQILTALEEDSDDEAPVGVAAAVKKADPQLAPLSTSQQPSGGASNRPPSPRSLLANPRMGTMMIAPAAHKNLQQEEEEPLEAAVKPRSRWQDEEEEEEEAQPQRKPPQQQQQQLNQGSGANGRHVTAPAAALPPPASERLMLNAKQEPHGNAAKGVAAAARDTGANIPPAPSRGEKLQLGEVGRQAVNVDITTAAAVPSAAVAPVKRPSRENAEKLSLGGPTVPLPGSRGSTPPVAEHSGGAGGTAPTEIPREEWEDDDWDSSDDDAEDKKRAAASAATAAAGPARRGQTPSVSGKPTAGAGSGRPGTRGSSGGGGIPTPPVEETCKSTVARPRRSSGGDRGPRAASTAAAPGADVTAARMSSDRGGTGARPSSGGSGAAAPMPAGSSAKGKAQQLPPPREQQRQEEEDEDDKEAILAKHAAGIDHLDDNWDSDEEHEEKEDSPRKPQGRVVPAAPTAPSPRQPAAKTSPPVPQRRIPGPPSVAPAPVPAARPAAPSAVPHAPTTGIARPPTAPKQPAAAPPLSASGARPRARVSQEGSVLPPPHPPTKPASGMGHATGGSAAARHKVDLHGGKEPLRSNVAHDPHAKPDDNNWVEENWDDDDD